MVRPSPQGLDQSRSVLESWSSTPTAGRTSEASCGTQRRRPADPGRFHVHRPTPTPAPTSTGPRPPAPGWTCRPSPVDLVLWDPRFFAVRPSVVIKGRRHRDRCAGRPEHVHPDPAAGADAAGAVLPAVVGYRSESHARTGPDYVTVRLRTVTSVEAATAVVARHPVASAYAVRRAAVPGPSSCSRAARPRR
jgi:hypothetical protein